MFKSMTSFGRAKVAFSEYEITVEIKSVNNRYFECQAKLPKSFSATEQKIKPALASFGVARGKVDVSVAIDGESNDGELSVNYDFADRYVELLRDMQARYGITSDIGLSDIIKMNDVFEYKAPVVDEQQREDDVMHVLSLAAEKFLTARKEEGERIEKDILLKLDNIKAHVDEIERISQNNIGGYKEKLEAKLKAVLADNNITLDENRILTECAIYADRAAIDEEIVRLKSHFCAFNEYTKKEEPVGRSIDFLLQEMNREINTIGSKCQDVEIAGHVVSVKTELEKIREQIQNIE